MCQQGIAQHESQSHKETSFTPKSYKQDPPVQSTVHKVGCLCDEDFIRACIRRTDIAAVLHSCQSFHYSHSFEDAIFTTVLALKSCLVNVHANKQCTDAWAHHVHTNAQTAKSRKLQQAQQMDTARHNISQGIGTMLINFQLHLLQTELQLVLPTSGVQ